VLENERDRIATILVTPFISCSARLPIYVLLAGTFFAPARAGQVIFSLYILGVVVALVMARLLRVYVVRGEPTPFVMELPPYRMPTAKSVIIHMLERAWMYIKKAGTIILAFSIAVWFLSNFPQNPDYGPELESAIKSAGGVENLAPELGRKAAAVKLENTYAGRLGGLIAPALKPAGLNDWRIAVSLMAGAAAKEVVVSTMGTLYSLGESSEHSKDLKQAIKADPFFSPLRAYAMMVFVLLYIPCIATIVVAHRELGSWKWTATMVGMSVGVAYILSAAVWWIGNLVGLG